MTSSMPVSCNRGNLKKRIAKLHAQQPAGLIIPFFSDAMFILLWWIYSVLRLCAGLGLLLLGTPATKRTGGRRPDHRSCLKQIANFLLFETR